METIIAALIPLIIGIFILYIVIATAVRRGINSSVIGHYLEKKYGIKEGDKKSFLDKDVDKD